MGILEDITSIFVERSREILGDNLAGVYLHGSAAMECYNEKKSDIDIVVVIHETVSNDTKRRFMDMVVQLNAAVPAKGLELSVVKKTPAIRSSTPRPLNCIFPMRIRNGTSQTRLTTLRI